MNSSAAGTPVWTRRDFLGAAGGLIVLFASPWEALGEDSVPGAWPETLSPVKLDSWLAILDDGRVLAAVGKIEAGMGVSTAFVQVVADELEVDLDRVELSMGDTATTVDQRGTGSSNGIVEGGSALKKAAAAARQHLLGLASVHFGVGIGQLSAASGVIRVKGDTGRSVSYAQLLGGKRLEITLPEKVETKAPETYRYVGKAVPRIDIPPKLDATYEYLVDLKVPGMLHARVVRPPRAGAHVLAVPSGFTVPGLVRVVHQGDFVAVVCEEEYQAVRAARELSVRWSDPAPLFPNSYEDLYTHLREATPKSTQVADSVGAIEEALDSAAQVVSGHYEYPFQSHACMAPACGVADVGPVVTTVWMGGQKPYPLRRAVATMLKRSPGNVRVIWLPGPGSYGMNDADDAAIDAVFLSSIVGRPVRVQYSRSEGTAWDPKGPPIVLGMRGGLDREGSVVAFEYEARGITGRLRASSTQEPGDSLWGQMVGGWKPKSTDRFQISAESYRFPNKRRTSHLIAWDHAVATGLRTAHLRDPDGMATCFASECFIDELAAVARIDPVEFRLRYLQDARDRAVVQAAANKAGWISRPSPRPLSEQTGSLRRGRGIAYAPRNGTTVAIVADVIVDVQLGRVWVERFVVAHDCGFVVNPGNLHGTIEANLIQGLSRALHEEVKFSSSEVLSNDWLTYPILDIKDVPRAIDIVLLNNRPEAVSTGAGEPATRPVAAAIGNALFDAMGVRVRRVPFTPENVLAALRSTLPV